MCVQVWDYFSDVSTSVGTWCLTSALYSMTGHQLEPQKSINMERQRHKGQLINTLHVYTYASATNTVEEFCWHWQVSDPHWRSDAHTISMWFYLISFSIQSQVKNGKMYFFWISSEYTVYQCSSAILVKWNKNQGCNAPSS